MPSLLAIIDALRQRVTRWAWGRAAAWGVACIVTAMLGLLAIDAVVRSPEAGWRWLQFSLLAAVAVTITRRLASPLKHPPTRAAIARQIEIGQPQLRDRLSSAVLFLEEQQRTPAAQAVTSGSPQLRERVILETAAECAGRDFTELLSPRALRRALLACGGVLALVLCLAIYAPQAVGIGFLRQVAPWRETNWPRTHELYIEADSLRLARGETFTAVVRDHRGTLPRDLILEIRPPRGAASISEPREEVPLTWQPESVTIRREGVRHHFEFRVTGGDDRAMNWTLVEVLEPARLEEIALRVIPPAPTRWPEYPADAPLLVLPGSSLLATGRTTRSLTSATLDYAGSKQALIIGADHRSFQIGTDKNAALPLPSAGKLHFEFTDTEGIVSSSDAYEVRFVPDQPPTIEWGTRASEELLTPSGEWPFTAAVRDDVAIERVELTITPLDGDPAKPAAPLVKELYRRAPAKAKPSPLDATELEALRRGRWPEERRPLNSFWSFPAPPALGSRWQATLQITDSAGQTASSEPRALKVVSPDELSARMANRWNELLRDLTALSELQQTAQRQVIEAVDRQPPTFTRTEPWVAAQRQISRELTLPSAKIPRQLTVLDQEFAANQLQQTASGLRLTLIQRKLAALRRGELAPLDQELAAWEQAIAAEQQTPEQLRPLLQALILRQAAVQQRLRELISELDQQTNWAQLERALQAIQQAQQTLGSESRENENLALGRNWEQLTAREQTILGGLAQRQTALAEQLAAWQNTLAKLRLDAASGALSAESLRALFLRLQPAELMRMASGNLAGNRLGQATQQQTEIIAALAEALELLRTGKSGKAPPSNSKAPNTDPANSKPATPPAEQLAELRKLQEQLAALEQRQAKLNQQTMQFSTLAPDQENTTGVTTATLTAEQEALYTEVTKLAAGLGSEGPLVFQLQRAAMPMQAAVTALRQNDAGDTTQREQRIALDRLRLLLMAFSSRDLPPPQEANKNGTKENPQQALKLQLSPRQVAELRLIRVLQLELTARTAAGADVARTITEPTAAEQRAAAQIADEQEKLRELLEQLIRETAPATEEN